MYYYALSLNSEYGSNRTPLFRYLNLCDQRFIHEVLRCKIITLKDYSLNVLYMKLLFQCVFFVGGVIRYPSIKSMFGCSNLILPKSDGT